ncbi:conserved hypothetical protein [Methylobacterium sp. 4-46]|uniref:hypothetical protein n=1 Tax=unclassified Methylobacterium TaxID=2615210 RepID=UPI000165C659|nr:MULTISPECIES: hypothetical protein [Methylobacterium]ACA17708.1 conserved hypothetical protein [Methylobacterium sp. 4-46]WFT83377.1 hypothetical protein QA634_16745 [Methylobacterium nodulans]
MRRLALPLLLAIGVATSAAAQPPLSGREPALLFHGNYCGPGNNAPLLPVDALDLACARHDACTPDGGLPSRACNARLAREAEAVARDASQPQDLRALAGMVATGAALLPTAPGAAPRPALSMRAAPLAGPVTLIAPRPAADPDALEPDSPDLEPADEAE